MKTEQKAVCPKCGKHYTGYPATSREDNSTYICPDCGIREALESIGVPLDEQEKILETIHGYGYKP
ncbi:MAG: hypothetical protein Q4G10_06645 [Bacteroidia bacterium]|nr:hypothetical protein [Bacteroidia bacterium]